MTTLVITAVATSFGHLLFALGAGTVKGIKKLNANTKAKKEAKINKREQVAKALGITVEELVSLKEII